MAGAGLLAIQRRIKSITSTKKITKAMGLVATAKLRKSRESLNLNRIFNSEFKEILKEVYQNYNKENIFNYGNDSKKKLILIFTSEIGLCGGFNNNVINKAVEIVNEDKANSVIALIGKKGRSYLNKFGGDVAVKLIDGIDSPEFKDGEAIAQFIMNMFLSGEVGHIYSVFTQFISGVKQIVEVEKLLPIPYKYDDTREGLIGFEPSMDLLADNITKLYLSEQILYYMLNSTSSEHSARMNAMNSATRNADDLLGKLKLKYNRVRQGIITQEISEIVGGAEALK